MHYLTQAACAQKITAAHNATAASSFLIICPGTFSGFKILEPGGNMSPRMGEWKVAEWRYETTSEERYVLQALLFSSSINTMGYTAKNREMLYVTVLSTIYAHHPFLKPAAAARQCYSGIAGS